MVAEREVSSTSNCERAIFLKRGNLQVVECVLPLKSLTHLSLSQSLTILESSTNHLKCVAEKKPFDMYSMCSSGDGGGPESGFTGIPILCHSSLRPLRVATDGTAGGLVKPRTLMGAVGRREAWPRGLPTPTSTSYIAVAPVAFLLPAPRLTHD